MGFAQDIQELRPRVEALQESMKVMTPEVLEAIVKMSSFDVEQLEKIAIASEKIHDARRDVLLVENGLSSIRRVVEMQNQVQYVSDARQNIGLVAGKIEDVVALAEYKHVMGAAVAMKPMIDETLALSIKMDAVLDMEEDIKDFIKTGKRMELVLADMNRTKYEISDFESQAREHLKNSMKIEARLINREKILDMKISQLQDFNVEVQHLAPEKEAYSIFTREKNTLSIGIPSGIQGPKGEYKGERGEPGTNGKDFSADYKGMRRERGRYCNYPVGTSYLSLDEIPTMIYFRKSNANDDWTDGQPFGVGGEFYSDGDTSIVNGINVQRLTDQVMHELDKRQRIIDGE